MQVFRQQENTKRRCEEEFKALASLSLLGPGSASSSRWLLHVLAQNPSVAELPWGLPAVQAPVLPPLSRVATSAFMFTAFFFFFFPKKVDPLFLCHLLL